MDEDDQSPSRDETLELDLEVDERARQMITLPNGQRTIKQPRRTNGTGLIHMTYVSRDMEWVNIKGAVKEWLAEVGMLDRIETIE